MTFKTDTLEVDLLIKRIAAGGVSGKFLGDAFLSAYRSQKVFNHSLSEFNQLDADAQRLFHEILHMKKNLSDDELYKIETEVVVNHLF